jgi:RNA polymerase sigma-70 factor, ECF subfamily
MDDSELLAATAKGDRAAFTELFHRFAPRVNGFLRQSLPAAKAEEVAQEVMVRVWRHASAYDPRRATVATWVFGIARNARIDALRRSSRPDPDPEDPTWVPASPEDPAAAAARRDDEDRVRAALDGLPPAQLEVLEHAYLQGRTLSEVADALGVPLGTVKSRVRLALAQLRVRLPPGED